MTKRNQKANIIVASIATAALTAAIAVTGTLAFTAIKNVKEAETTPVVQTIAVENKDAAQKLTKTVEDKDTKETKETAAPQKVVEYVYVVNNSNQKQAQQTTQQQTQPVVKREEVKKEMPIVIDYDEYGFFYVTSQVGLNVRTSPTTDADNIIGHFQFGDKVDVVGRVAGADWVQIRYNGQIAYVNRTNISATDPKMNTSGINENGEFETNNNGTPSYIRTNSNELVKDAQYMVKVDYGFLALRETPAFDNDSNIVAELHTGDIVNVKENYGTYCCVYVPSIGQLGFVNSNYLVAC